MKKILLYSVLCIIASVPLNTYAQSWLNVGLPGFSAAEADYESIAIGKHDTLFAAFQDYGNGSKATVMKFNGTSWVAVGTPGFSDDMAESTFLSIDSSGIPYVIYEDYADSTKATVKKFDGSNWVTVGSQGFSIGSAFYTTMAIGSSGTPYVTFLDIADSCITRISVMIFDGSNWVYVGTPRFSPIISNPVSIAVWANTPYIAYSDTGIGKVTVLTWDGSNWVPLGTPGFSAGQAGSITITTDNTGTPYVTYTDYANSRKATVMKYNGSAWVTVGSAGFSAAEADNIVIAIDASGKPYVAYSDINTVDYATTVKKFDGTSWITLGAAGFSGTLSNYITIAIDGSGIVYAGYQGFTGGKKITVEKYDPSTTGIKNIANSAATLSILPNPAHSSFVLHISSPQKEEATIIITNMLGEEVRQFTATSNADTHVQLDAPPGIYFITAITKEGSLNEKIVLE